jgi:dipeptidyl aminopeptidase/acylaminoacyl peptidase
LYEFYIQYELKGRSITLKSINIKPYLYVRTANNPAYSPDGKKVTFITNYTGVPQVWEYQKGTGWPSQVSFTDERIMFVTYISGSNKRIIGMDIGVNERQQLFLLGDDGDLLPLTDAPDYIHHYGGSSPDGKQIAWSSNRRNFAFFDVYVQDLTTLEARQVFVGDGTYSVLKWHPSGISLLIQKSNSNLDNDLGILTLSSGEVTWLTLHEGEAHFSSAQFSPDGETIYVLSNQDREFKSLVSINLGTGELTWLDEYEWDIEGLALNHTGHLLAYTINEAGVSKGILRELQTNKETEWTTPPGVIEELTFSPDDRKLAFIFNGATHPSEIWELDLASGEIERLTYVSNSPAVEDQLVEPELIQFKSFDGLEVPAFYYKPKHVEGPYPVVVFVHGGPESQIRSVYNPFLQYFISRGYAVCTPNVRGSTGYGKSYTHLDDVRKRMDSVKDLVSLVEWLKTDGNADPNKIAIMGRSYGGFVVLAAVTHYPDLWAAGIDIVGISSFKSFLENTSIWRRKLREAEYGSLENDTEFFNDIDPIHRTDKITAPMIVLHGANDPRVPISETEQIVNDLRKRNRPVEYVRFEDEGHFFVKLKNNIVAYTEVANFLDKWIK